MAERPKRANPDDVKLWFCHTTLWIHEQIQGVTEDDVIDSRNELALRLGDLLDTVCGEKIDAVKRAKFQKVRRKHPK